MNVTPFLSVNVQVSPSADCFHAVASQGTTLWFSSSEVRLSSTWYDR